MLTTPWALLALVSVPILLGIYFFRTRSRRREVSSLFLWIDPSQAKLGGRRISRLQLPFWILLELLVLILLAVAAARPVYRVESQGRPTAIILDASYSMSAGNPETARNRAESDLDRLFDSMIGYPVQFIVAGSKPELISGRAKNAVEAREFLKSWQCNAPTAAIDAAISLASNISTPGTKIMVVTDQPPQGPIVEGRVLWKSYGMPLDNWAIVHASRVFQGEKDRLLLEIANFSPKPRTLRMVLAEPKKNKVLLQVEEEVGPMAIYRLRTGIPDGVDEIEVRLAEDSLAVDNRLTLFPPNRRPLRVQVGRLPEELAEKIEKGVESSGIATLVQDAPELIFGTISTDPQRRENASETESVWNVRFFSESDSNKIKSFIGPFVIDRSSSLTAGLSLDGVVWSGTEHPEMDGLPIIAAGNVPLLTEIRRRNGTRTIQIQLNDRLSTLSGNPAWPILIWNILKYRSEQTVGVVRCNLKLGTEAEFVPAKNDKQIVLTSPDGNRRTIPLSDGPIRLAAEQTGVYRIDSASGTYSFAVGTLSPEESNLQQAKTEFHGNWLDEETLRNDYRSAIWLFLLAALGLLVVHHRVIAEKPLF